MRKTKKRKEEIEKPIVTTRALICIGGSFYIGIPRSFVVKFRLKPGDRLPVISDSIVKIVPMSEIA